MIDVKPDINTLAPHFINTHYFREAALSYKANEKKGIKRYITAPIGSKEWYEWWEEQERRCLNGYSVGGVKVTGRHYFYMNFTQLKKVEEAKKGAVVAFKAPDFPSFYEIDYDWFWYKEIGWWGCTPEQLAALKLWRNPTYLKGGRHLSCLKTRRAGFSYKEAADGVYNYNFIDGSKNYYFAAVEQYLTVDGILNKVESDLNFLNENTDGFWLRNRMSNSTLMHQTASYKPKTGGKKGTHSEIMGVIVNDVDKVRGKDGIKITYEEGGSFPDLIRALKISVPSVKEGVTLTGQISVFGTGGTEKGTHIEGLQEVYENPNDYDMLTFENDWEEGFQATGCGVFIPTSMANPSFMDKDGNVDKVAANSWEDSIREKMKKGNIKNYDLHIAENPQKPSEALMRVTNSDFPKAAALEQRARVINSKEIQGLLKYGHLVRSPTKGLTFKICSKAEGRPIDYYPHKFNDKLAGCIVMVEEPQFAKVSTFNPLNRTMMLKYQIPDDVYLITVDPYYKDDADDLTSLYSILVTKRRSKYFDNNTEKEVAWFTGRMNKVQDCHDIALDITEFYNGKLQSEIAGGGQGLYDRAKERKKLHLLHFENEKINNKEIQKTSKNRSYFMNISTDDKKNGIMYESDWLKKVVGIDENGNEIWNLHYIYDVGYLDEVIKFHDDGNFDRLSTRIVRQFMIKELRDTEKKKNKDKNKQNAILGKRKLFVNREEQNYNKPFIMRNDIM